MPGVGLLCSHVSSHGEECIICSWHRELAATVCNKDRAGGQPDDLRGNLSCDTWVAPNSLYDTFLPVSADVSNHSVILFSCLSFKLRNELVTQET